METSSLIASILNFSVVVFVLVFFGRKPFSAFLVSRSEALKNYIGEAEKLSKEANAELSKWEQASKQSDAHVKQNKIDAEESLKKFKEKTLATAKVEAERIQKDAEMMGSSELQKARQGLEEELVGRSVELAQLHLAEHLAPQDKRKLVTDFVELVGHGTR